jgi:hypothetical protein
MIHSYPSIYAIGHKAIDDLFTGPVLVEEKVDGSQFSMGRSWDNELLCRSKGQQIVIDAPEGMFRKAVDVAGSLPLVPGWIYRCEYLEKPKHNTLTYGRVPASHLIIFDICPGLEEYLKPHEKKLEAERLGLECVPVLFEGLVTDFEMFKSFMARESVLGGCTVEGVVVKNYALFTMEKKIALGKYVSEGFKEKNAKDWKERNPVGRDFVQELIATYRTEARWHKAIQHLREAGQIEGSPRDIGLLMREVPSDVLKEYGDEIKEALFKHFWKDIHRGLTAGLPEWYKDELAKTAFVEAVPAGRLDK